MLMCYSYCIVMLLQSMLGTRTDDSFTFMHLTFMHLADAFFQRVLDVIRMKHLTAPCLCCFTVHVVNFFILFFDKQELSLRENWERELLKGWYESVEKIKGGALHGGRTESALSGDTGGCQMLGLLDWEQRQWDSSLCDSRKKKDYTNDGGASGWLLTPCCDLFSLFLTHTHAYTLRMGVSACLHTSDCKLNASSALRKVCGRVRANKGVLQADT